MEPKITGLCPKFLDALNAMLAEAKARGLSVGIQSGLRDAAQQDRLYALGRTVKNLDSARPDKPMGDTVTNARGWSSWHNYGLAADVVYKDSKGNWTWNKTAAQWEELGNVGEMFGLQWLARTTIKGMAPDFPHFQMIGRLTGVKEAKKILTEQGQDALWAMV
jgi:peptidoglycan L-alanyl-D-glutamate endopeptidase CwlK